MTPLEPRFRLTCTTEPIPPPQNENITSTKSCVNTPQRYRRWPSKANKESQAIGNLVSNNMHCSDHKSLLSCIPETAQLFYKNRFSVCTATLYGLPYERKRHVRRARPACGRSGRNGRSDHRPLRERDVSRCFCIGQIINCKDLQCATDWKTNQNLHFVP